MYLVNTNGVWEASKKTLIFIVGLHKEVEVLLGLENEQIKTQGRKSGAKFGTKKAYVGKETTHRSETDTDNRQHTEPIHH